MELKDYTTEELRAEISRRYAAKKAERDAIPRCRLCVHFGEVAYFGGLGTEENCWMYHTGCKFHKPQNGIIYYKSPKHSQLPPLEGIYYKEAAPSISSKRTELQFIEDSIDWESRRFELVKAAMQGTSLYSKIKIYSKETISKFVIELADAVLAEYRKGEKQ